MEEKKNMPEDSSKESPPKTEIDALVKELVQKEVPPKKTTSDDKITTSKTPLDNLKNILSHADATMSAEKQPSASPMAANQVTTPMPSAKSPKEEISVPMKVQTLTQEKKSVLSFESDAVEKLDELIKAHRAKKPSGNKNK